MEIYEEVNEPVKKRTKVICNKSGKEIDFTTYDNFEEQNLMHPFKICFGYGSDFDEDVWEFDLDEQELLDFVRTFKHRPKGFAEHTKHPDKVFEEWKRTGEFDYTAGWSKEEIEENNMLNKSIGEAFGKILFERYGDNETD